MNTSTTRMYQSERQEAQSILREKGQLTVPMDVRDILELQEGDKVSFVITRDKKIEVMKKPSIVARTAGVLKSTKHLLSAEALRMEAEQTIAKEAIQRGK